MSILPADTVTRTALPAPANDSELLARFLNSRDEAAFGEIVVRHGGLVMAVAWRALRNRQAAEDVFQATFLVLAQRAQAIRRRDSLAAWLHGTAYRVARKSLARRQRCRECAMPPDEPAARVFDDVARHEEQMALDEELARLPESLRGPMILHYVQEKSAPEIAEELGLGVAAVEGRLRRGRRDLHLKLLRRGLGLSGVIAAANAVAAPAEAAVGATLVGATAQACVAASLGATLPALVSPEAAHLSAKELVAMSKIGLMKTAVAWSAVALGVTLTGAVTTGTLLSRVQAQEAAGSADSATTLDQPISEGATIDPGGLFAGAGVGTPTAIDLQSQTTPGATEARPPATPPIEAETPPDRGYARRALPSATSPIEAATGADPAGLNNFSGLPYAKPAAIMMSGMGAAGMPPGMMGQGGESSPTGKVTDYKDRNENELRIEEALASRVQFNFVGAELHDVTTYIAEQFQINVRLDVAALDGAGITPDVQVQLAASGITLESALHELLANFNGVPLDYIVQYESLVITSASSAAQSLETRVYDVRSMGSLPPEVLARVIAHSIEPQSWMPSIVEEERLQSRVGGSNGGSGSSGGVPLGARGQRGMFRGMSPASTTMMLGSSSAAADLAAPASLGGGEGWIEPIDGALVITQSQPIHRRIVSLLEQLERQASAVSRSRSNMSGMMMPPGSRSGMSGMMPPPVGAPMASELPPLYDPQPLTPSATDPGSPPAAPRPLVPERSSGSTSGGLRFVPQPSSQPQPVYPPATPGRPPGSPQPNSARGARGQSSAFSDSDGGPAGLSGAAPPAAAPVAPAN